MQCFAGVQIRWSSTSVAATVALDGRALSGDDVDSCAIVRNTHSKVRAMVTNVLFMAANEL